MNYQSFPFILWVMFESYITLFLLAFPIGLAYKFKNIELIQMWMEQGLIQPFEQYEEMGDIDNWYIDELLQKSFFQDVEETPPRFAYAFEMHDLALLVAQLRWIM